VLALAPAAVSLAIAASVLLELARLDVPRILALVPRAPAFWAVFALYYLAGPLSEWLIYHRLWRLPVEGFVALLRKLVCNELLLGYLGEAYFYAWARQRKPIAEAPFGAIKDVSILSAMAGNLVTLGLLVVIWPVVGATSLGLASRTLVLSLSVVLATSLLAMLFRRRIFSLGRADLRFIMATHLARLAATTTLSALLWHLALPGVPLTWWLFLATVRLLVSRLPFLPNKDIVFAGIAVVTLGRHADIAALLTMMAAVIVLAHLVVGTLLSLADIARRVLARQPALGGALG